jgi:hypothetical protein
MKQRNPRWGCPRIAEQIALAFNLAIDKDVVRRILAHHHWPQKERSFLTSRTEMLWRLPTLLIKGCAGT